MSVLYILLIVLRCMVNAFIGTVAVGMLTAWLFPALVFEAFLASQVFIFMIIFMLSWAHYMRVANNAAIASGRTP